MTQDHLELNQGAGNGMKYLAVVVIILCGVAVTLVATSRYSPAASQYSQDNENLGPAPTQTDTYPEWSEEEIREYERIYQEWLDNMTDLEREQLAWLEAHKLKYPALQPGWNEMSLAEQRAAGLAWQDELDQYLNSFKEPLPENSVRIIPISGGI